jgi:uncharacterized protein
MTTALVTGASTGLGREFVRLFAADGIDVILVASARSASKLERLADELCSRDEVAAHAISMDLAAPGAAHELDAHVADLGIDVEYLVNNAGFGIVGLRIQDCDPEEVSRMTRLNVLTVTELTMLYVPRMVRRGHGSILNVSSIAGYVVPHGLEAAYAASKAYIVSFSESVGHDLRGTGVTCTHLAPGPTRTEFFPTAGLRNDSRLGLAMMDAATVAATGYAAMRAGRATVMPGLAAKTMRVAAALSPAKRLTGIVSGYFVTRR